MNDAGRIRNAYHEAGHAAAMLVLITMHPDYATILPDSERGSTGHVKTLKVDNLTRAGMRDWVVQCYAGRAAEKLVGGSGVGSWGDDGDADGYLKFKGVGTEPELRGVANRLVAEHHVLVECIARELLEREALDAGELVFLFEIYRGEATRSDLEEYRHNWGDDLQRLRQGLNKRVLIGDDAGGDTPG